MAPRELKQAVLDTIASLLGVSPRPVSRGSTESKQSLVDVVHVLKLPISTTLSKPALARAIAEHAGLDWEREHDSTQSASGGGSTITTAGLQRVREAVQLLLGAPPAPARAPGVHGKPYVTAKTDGRTDRAIFERDPEAYDRGSNAHGRLQNEIAEELAARSIAPLVSDADAGDPPFDVAWRIGPVLHVCEVKSTTESNQKHQIRLGIGQLLEYRARLEARGETEIVSILAVERAVSEVHRRACALAEVVPIARPTLCADLDSVLGRA